MQAHPILISLGKAAEFVAAGNATAARAVVCGTCALWVAVGLFGAAVSRWSQRRDGFAVLAHVSLLVLGPVAVNPYLEPYHLVSLAVPAAAGAHRRAGRRSTGARAGGRGERVRARPGDSEGVQPVAAAGPARERVAARPLWHRCVGHLGRVVVAAPAITTRARASVPHGALRKSLSVARAEPSSRSAPFGGNTRAFGSPDLSGTESSGLISVTRLVSGCARRPGVETPWT